MEVSATVTTSISPLGKSSDVNSNTILFLFIVFILLSIPFVVLWQTYRLYRQQESQLIIANQVRINKNNVQSTFTRQNHESGSAANKGRRVNVMRGAVKLRLQQQEQEQQQQRQNTTKFFKSSHNNCSSHSINVSTEMTSVVEINNNDKLDTNVMIREEKRVCDDDLQELL